MICTSRILVIMQIANRAEYPASTRSSLTRPFA
jgi:hypothetical protein